MFILLVVQKINMLYENKEWFTELLQLYWLIVLFSVFFNYWYITSLAIFFECKSKVRVFFFVDYFCVGGSDNALGMC